MFRMFTLAATYRNLFRYNHPYAARAIFYGTTLTVALLAAIKVSAQ